MEENGKLPAAKGAIETKEHERDKADRKLFAVSIYKTILTGLDKKQAATINGNEVLVIIEKSKESLPSEFIRGDFPTHIIDFSEWGHIQHKARVLRKERLKEKDAHKNPSTKDINEVTEELLLGCQEINIHAKRDISLIYEKLTTVIFPEAEE